MTATCQKCDCLRAETHGRCAKVTGHNSIPGRCDLVPAQLTSSSPPLLGSSDTAAARSANASLCSLRDDSSAAVLADCACAAARQYGTSVLEVNCKEQPVHTACTRGHAAWLTYGMQHAQMLGKHSNVLQVHEVQAKPQVCGQQSGFLLGPCLPGWPLPVSL
jgi:hypothetical protein